MNQPHEPTHGLSSPASQIRLRFRAAALTSAGRLVLRWPELVAARGAHPHRPHVPPSVLRAPPPSSPLTSRRAAALSAAATGPRLRGAVSSPGAVLRLAGEPHRIWASESDIGFAISVSVSLIIVRKKEFRGLIFPFFFRDPCPNQGRIFLSHVRVLRARLSDFVPLLSRLDFGVHGGGLGRAEKGALTRTRDSPKKENLRKMTISCRIKISYNV